MTHHRNTFVGVATAIAAVCMALPAFATPPVGTWKPQPLSFGSFNDLTVMGEKTGKWDIMIRAKGTTDLRVTRVPFAVGTSSGWHSHPGPNLLTVSVGEVVVYEGSDPLCVGKTYKKGQTFSDNGGSAFHLVRNESANAAEIIAVALYPNGVTPTTNSDRPVPNNCNPAVL